MVAAGPRARSSASASLTRKPFTWAMGEMDGIEVMVNRTGYTGERGLELMTPAEDGAVRDAVVARGAKPCGLGARDTLRLEGLLPAARQRHHAGNRRSLRRAGLDVRPRHGLHRRTEELRRIKGEGPRQKLVAFVMTEKAVPRQGMPIDRGGVVTSGSHSPTLDVGIGMGYVPVAQAEPDTESTIDVRGRAARVS